MVSLSRSFNTNSGVRFLLVTNLYVLVIKDMFQGATFFSESVNMDDRQHLQPILDSYGIFKPLKTIPHFTFQLVFTFVLDIIAIVYAVIHPDQKNRCKEYFVIIYLHIALWFLTLVRIFCDKWVFEII